MKTIKFPLFFHMEMAEMWGFGCFISYMPIYFQQITWLWLSTTLNDSKVYGMQFLRASKFKMTEQQLENFKPYLSPSFFLVFLTALGAVLGTSIYFALSFEPSAILMAICSMFLCVFLFLLRQNLTAFYMVFLLFITCAFVSWTAYIIQGKQTYILPEKYNENAYWVVGQIEDIKTSSSSTKLMLNEAEFYGELEGVPSGLKVRVGGASSRFKDLEIGDWVALQMKVFSPRNPLYDDSYDFRRQAYLSGVSAVGYVWGQVYKTSWPQGFEQSFYRLNKLRKKLTNTVVNEDVENIAERSIMAALTTGNKMHIPEYLYEAYRESGMAHLLAISGLHIGLVVGFFFVFIRRIIGFNAWIVHRVNTKKISAFLAIFVAGSYMLIAGATLPTLRAFIMVSIVLYAMVLGRITVVLRTFFLTVFVVLFIWPESVLSASFQMSFSAVLVLVIWAEKQRISDEIKGKFYGGFYDAIRYVQGVFVTSFLAGLATLPIAAFHFGSISLSGILVNVFAIPVTAFIVMPSALLGFVLMPFGGHEIGFSVMQFGVYILNEIALWGQGLKTSGLPIFNAAKWTFLISIPIVLFTFFFTKKRYTLLAVLFSIFLYKTESYFVEDKIYLTHNAKTAVLLGRDDLTIIYGKPTEYNDEKALDYFIKNYFGEEKELKEIGTQNCDAEGCLINNIVAVRENGITDELCYGDKKVIAPKILWRNDCPTLVQVPKDTQGIYVFSSDEISVLTQRYRRVWH